MRADAHTEQKRVQNMHMHATTVCGNVCFIQYFHVDSSSMVRYWKGGWCEEKSSSSMVWLKYRVNVESRASNNTVTELKKCQDEWSPRSHRLAQTLRVWLFPRSELSYYSGLVSGPLSSNYCTLMAGPITSRLIVWSLPYVQPAVLLIHPHMWDHNAASTPTSEQEKCVKVSLDERSNLGWGV